jgi:hypothetical protein
MTGEDVAGYCEYDIRILRRLMRNIPMKTGEHFEIWVVMPFGRYYAIEVLVDTVLDVWSGIIISPQTPGGVPA